LALDPQTRARLLASKLKALVESTAGPLDRRSLAFPGGAALTGDDGTWVLADALGPALAVARETGSFERLRVIVETGDLGAIARQASQLASPPMVYGVADRRLVVAEPSPLPVEPPLDPRVAALADEITAAGADPVVEHGRLVGEVEGLEVCRVELRADGPVLTVGVGRFDREANELLRGDSLERVVDLVRLHRVVDPEPHPLKRWAAARGLRSRVIREPGLVGADHLAPMSATAEAPDLRTAWPAPAAGLDLDGEPLVVVCSVGVDLNLVPMAADARLADGRRGRLVLAVPARDAHPVTVDLAAALAQPATVVVVA
jgi:hypothetical protein